MGKTNWKAPLREVVRETLLEPENGEQRVRLQLECWHMVVRPVFLLGRRIRCDECFASGQVYDAETTPMQLS